jgi:hypothetical protein
MRRWLGGALGGFGALLGITTWRCSSLRSRPAESHTGRIARHPAGGGPRLELSVGPPIPYLLRPFPQDADCKEQHLLPRRFAECLMAGDRRRERSRPYRHSGTLATAGTGEPGATLTCRRWAWVPAAPRLRAAAIQRGDKHRCGRPGASRGMPGDGPSHHPQRLLTC